MKNFLSKNWRNIIYAICAIAIIINLIIIITTPATIPEQFYKYGPEVKSGIIYDANGNIIEASKDGVDSAIDVLAETDIFDNDSARIVVWVSLLICIVLIVSSLLDNGSSDKKKK